MRSMNQQNGVSLGRSLLAEMRASEDELGDASDLLRWGADGVDDETLWQAVMTAVEGARDDGERWTLGDGVIDESLGTRPSLASGWHSARGSSAQVREVFRVMHEYLDENGHDRGWWDHRA